MITVPLMESSMGEDGKNRRGHKEWKMNKKGRSKPRKKKKRAVIRLVRQEKKKLKSLQNATKLESQSNRKKRAVQKPEKASREC